MLTLLEQLDKGTLWPSPGGIHPPGLKSQSNQQIIGRLPLTKRFIVPVPQVGEQAILTVKVGDRVLKGQILTEGNGFIYLPVHAPTSGTVIDVAPHASNHASALPVLSCTIEADGLDEWCHLEQATPTELSTQTILHKIKMAGIAGMGGAAFPSHVKLNPASEINLVIINGVECEPYITSDDRLMREHSAEILMGISIIHQLLQPKRIVIAIEDNKPEAIEAVRLAIIDSSLPPNLVRVTVVPTKYPSGGEKQLIQIITGKEVPSGALPAQLGVVVHNIATAFAIQDAVLHGKPLIERVVTLTGKNIARPGNYWLPIGSNIADTLELVGFSQAPQQKVIVGGPMMGYTLSRLDVPVLKGTNCLLAPDETEIAPDVDEKACIRCGECAVACPALLLPQQLFWHAKAQEYDKAASYNLKDCIECGCCSYVCPSDIPLVEYYRVAKSALKIEAEEKVLAEQAKIRFEARLERLEEEKNAREAKAKEAAIKRQANMKSTDKDAVAAAMERIAAKKALQTTGPDSTAQSTVQSANHSDANNKDSTAIDPKKAAVNAAIERAKAKKAALAASSPQSETIAHSETPNIEPLDDNKSKVAAAVARAKAKKAQQTALNKSKMDQTEPNQDEQTSDIDSSAQNTIETPVNDKQAKIAVAVARAKAKKAQQAEQDKSAITSSERNQIDLSSAINHSTQSTSEGPVDDKQAKIAAAVARAKAKKALQTAMNNSETDQTTLTQSELNTDEQPSAAQADVQTPADDKQAKVAAAVAKAKARKLALASEHATHPNDAESVNASKINTPDSMAKQEDQTLSADDIKKAKVAAAVAKAKARKQLNAEQKD